MNLFATVIFFIAVTHALLCNHFLKLAQRRRAKIKNGTQDLLAATYDFLGNITVIFGLWLVPILLYMLIEQGTAITYNYVNSMDFQEPFTYFVLITLASTRPLHLLFESTVKSLSRLFKGSLVGWWATSILFSTLLTGFFSEVAVMMLICVLLANSFYILKPSLLLSYFTLTLLLIGLSLGSVIIPVNFTFAMNLLNGGEWNRWTLFQLFGVKIFFAFVVALLIIMLFFRQEFASLQKKFQSIETKRHPISFREIFYLILFVIASLGRNNFYLQFLIVAIVIILHKYHYRKKDEEGTLGLSLPLLIAFFTYTLELHASFQKWWVISLFQETQGFLQYTSAFFLTGLNEHVPLEGIKLFFSSLDNQQQFFISLSVMLGGGLTLIANSANVVAKLTLRKYFPNSTISPIKHIFFALPIAGIVFIIAAILFFSTN